ncbi:hypothetical protein SAMN03080598_00576 [Algoriphagus boritolerans DSM 17298 = JCM 18970]|uniref:Uncharacterized protein n=1 Tax=Algoriphagus boritolerans DSM 17298 = JCM 18970 TaxID=1120964 RepID=A0A1H5SXH7_9BACT|nr:hypothetical protein SAMN03080598_00576 [Algoriphagus boritolerans DSM 17298 = JCM 18970]
MGEFSIKGIILRFFEFLARITIAASVSGVKDAKSLYKLSKQVLHPSGWMTRIQSFGSSIPKISAISLLPFGLQAISPSKIKKDATKLILILQSFKADNIIPQVVLIEIVPVGIVGGDVESFTAYKVIPGFDLVRVKKMVSYNFQIGV